MSQRMKTRAQTGAAQAAATRSKVAKVQADQDSLNDEGVTLADEAPLSVSQDATVAGYSTSSGIAQALMDKFCSQDPGNDLLLESIFTEDSLFGQGNGTQTAKELREHSAQPRFGVADASISRRGKRQLLVLLDGTGASPEQAEIRGRGTNIQGLRDVLGASYSRVEIPGETPRERQQRIKDGWEVFKCSEDGVDRLVFYGRGLGARHADVSSLSRDASPALSKYEYWAVKTFLKSRAETNMVGSSPDPLDMLLALKIVAHVVQAYFFIMDNYQSPSSSTDDDGDEIFIFGFSRGAYTARLLITFLRAIGVMKQGDIKMTSEKLGIALTAEEQVVSMAQDIARAAKAYAMLTTAQPAQMEAFAKENSVATTLNRGPDHPFVTFVGLFDTVPGPIAPLVVDDPVISSIVKCARHALAIDEHRSYFKPLLWVPSQAVERKNSTAVAELKKIARQEQGELMQALDGSFLSSLWERLENGSEPHWTETQVRAATPASHQIWFPGAHSDVGGSYDDARLSNVTLLWMLSEAVRLGGLKLRRQEFLQYPRTNTIGRKSFSEWLADGSTDKTSYLKMEAQASNIESESLLTWSHAASLLRTGLGAAERDLSSPAPWEPRDSFADDPSHIFQKRVARGICCNSTDETIHQIVWDWWQLATYAPVNVRRILMARFCVAGARPRYRVQRPPATVSWERVTRGVYAITPEDVAPEDLSLWYVQRESFSVPGAGRVIVRRYSEGPE